MKITNIEARVYAKDTTQPALAKRSGLIACLVETDAGITGLSYSPAGPQQFVAAPELMKTIIEGTLAPLVVGQDPYAYEHLWDTMFRRTYGIGRRGVVIHAIAAIDIALWDIMSKAANQPLYKYLGAHKERIAVYANCAFHYPPDRLAEQALKYVRQGYKCVKFQGGTNAVDTETATQRVKAVREAIGPDIDMMVDCNGSWDRETAMRMLRKWEPYNLFWIEEPVSPDDYDGFAVVAATTRTPIVTGEQHATRYDFRQLMLKGGVRILQPDACRVGGITEWLKVANAAAVFGMPIAPHALQEVHVHLSAAIPNFYIQEYFMVGNTLHEMAHTVFAADDSIYDFDPQTATIRPPQEPGIGLKFQADAEKYRVA
ncbi:MAG: mandelate racemase/muconate lactonizing enzyme family protein [Bacteroidetes bacterium]|nr:mandelate racemase/muconate lactonizing enzyme family protein [Bacteroidota bacterium]MCL5025972.1 mandelate racemase/muconate lactonizing enzyme family protein [Chloroflexota bacterium]